MESRPTVSKLSVSLPRSLATEVKKHAGSRGVSAFAARAMKHELERIRLGALLADLEDELGPPDEAAVKQADRLWPDS